MRGPVRFEHHEDGRVAFGLALQVITQGAGLVGFDCLCGLDEELFDLEFMYVSVLVFGFWAPW